MSWRPSALVLDVADVHVAPSSVAESTTITPRASGIGAATGTLVPCRSPASRPSRPASPTSWGEPEIVVTVGDLTLSLAPPPRPAVTCGRTTSRDDDVQV